MVCCPHPAGLICSVPILPGAVPPPGPGQLLLLPGVSASRSLSPLHPPPPHRLRRPSLSLHSSQRSSEIRIGALARDWRLAFPSFPLECECQEGSAPICLLTPMFREPARGGPVGGTRRGEEGEVA